MQRLKTLASRLWADRWRRRLLIAWGSLPIVELVLFATDMRRVSLAGWAVEILALVACGVVHAALAPDDWRGSAAWPGTVATALGVVRLVHELFALGFSAVTAVIPLVALGIGLLAFLMVRLLDRVLWRRLPAVLLTFTGPFVMWLVSAGPQVVRFYLPVPAPTAQGAPLVVITVDTLRSDMAAEMESWRWLERRGATWPRAMSASSWTWPALVTLWSGVAAEEHGSGRAPGMRQQMRDWSAELAWLDDAPAEGFLLWVHLSEPHLPYRHTADPSWDYNLLRNARSGDWFLGEAERAAVVEAHRREVAYADVEVLRLLQAIEARGLLAKGALIFTSDHGEEFWEHGGFEHGHAHHGEVIDVPLALVAPGVAPGAAGGVASLQDIAPTLRAIAGLDTAPEAGAPAAADARPGLAGLDLRRPLPAERVARAWGTAYFRPLHSYRVGDRRVIVADGEAVAYDLAADPGELRPLPVTPEELAALAAGRAAPTPAPGALRDLDEDLLRSLGYVH